ncbi:MAG: hypothetical protein ABL958_12440 [Bdellovibrionia bacterium]
MGRMFVFGLLTVSLLIFSTNATAQITQERSPECEAICSNPARGDECANKCLRFSENITVVEKGGPTSPEALRQAGEYCRQHPTDCAGSDLDPAMLDRESRDLGKPKAGYEYMSEASCKAQTGTGCPREPLAAANNPANRTTENSPPAAPKEATPPSQASGTSNAIPQETAEAKARRENEMRAAADECVSRNRRAEVACGGDQYAPVVSQLINSFSSARANGSINEACKSAGRAAMISSGMQTAFAAACKRASETCVTVCDQAVQLAGRDPTGSTNSTEYRRKARTCDGYSDQWINGLAQSLRDLNTYAESQNCVAATADRCGAGKGYNDPTCIAYCTMPQHRAEKICSPVACDLAQNKDSLLCFCQANPTDTTRCAGLQALLPPAEGTKPSLGSNPGGRTGVGAGTGFDLDGDGESDQGMQGQPSAPVKAASVNYGGQGGGGVGGGGSTGGGGIGGNGKGKQDGPYNADVLRGYGASTGGGGGTYSGGYGSNNNGLRGNRKDEDFDPLKYMPKFGEKGGRAPASISAQLYNQGITDANGLSNFEKVTRKMNEKRPVLVP